MKRKLRGILFAGLAGATLLTACKKSET
ncbi:putative small secreted protein, partial [Mucilaginibacter lappiensis]|nr:putative small secreted protein [Mucilaginibacter lappiensis]MBB6131880.1 putative small secreted protein [Mucilaginibacter lappiensis]